MSHTPGPWHVNGECIECDGPDGPRDLTVAMVVPFREERQANANLIAAAPELLRELKNLLSLWEEAIGWEKAYMDMGDAARAAIAKAEGRE